jgi:hypothetical protein
LVPQEILPKFSLFVDVAGEYTGSVSIAPDNRENPPIAPNILPHTFTVIPATCNITHPFRCPGKVECVASRQSCLSNTCPYGYCVSSIGARVCLTQVSEYNQCYCTPPLLHCVTGATFYCSASCPTATSNVNCPYDCGAGICRASAADCPSAKVCPTPYLLCGDGVTCVKTAIECRNSTLQSVQTSNPCTGNTPYQCRSGVCVARLESCSTDITCPPSTVLCSDGSCKPTANECPNQYSCIEGFVRCANGECRRAFSDCSSGVTCPIQYVKCPNGHCVSSASDCMPATTCAGNEVRCPTGECRSNRYLCPSQPACPNDYPVLCPDKSCVKDVIECPIIPSCKSPFPYPCSDGTCGFANGTSCGTPKTCPITAPTLCSDGRCVQSSNNCSALAPCPIHQSIRCSDGSCRGSSESCSSQFICPLVAPVRCPDGSCQSSMLMCGDTGTNLACPIGQVQCSTGACAISFSACPTVVSCGIGLIRCYDGTCRGDCGLDNFYSDSVSLFQAGKIMCPRTSQGVWYAISINQCPTEITCPSSTPIRCQDNSCAQSLSDCPAPASALISTGYVACPGGGWAQYIGLCNHGVTCPSWSPVKCWDEQCRLTPDDCPPLSQQCGATAVALKFNFLCYDGTCKEPKSCPPFNACGSGRNVKCPVSGFSTGTCVTSSPNECTNLFANLTTNYAVSPCPNNKVLCRSGACVLNRLLCPGFNCPAYAPILCNSGLCVSNINDCPNNQGCAPGFSRCKFAGGQCLPEGECGSNNPVSSAITSLCPPCPPSGVCRGILCNDGTCQAQGQCNSGSSLINVCQTENNVRCWDGTCVTKGPVDDMYINCRTDGLGNYAADGSNDLPNSCPITRPYRCNDGYCAISAIKCPVFPLTDISSCPSITPFRCADGSCQKLSEYCKVIRPCKIQFSVVGGKIQPSTQSSHVRCSDGTCRLPSQCPLMRTSFSYTGLSLDIIRDRSKYYSCPIDRPIRCGNGLCVADLFGVQSTDAGAVHQDTTTNPFSAGFDRNPNCIDELDRDGLLNSAFDYRGCPWGNIKCGDGTCRVSCSVTIAQAIAYPNGLAGGCSDSTPFKCFDGSCAVDSNSCPYYPSGCLRSNNLPYLCADGSCALNRGSCPGSSTCNNIRCPSGRCVTSYDQCLTTQNCPVQKPIRCADGSCARYPAHVGSKTALEFMDSCPAVVTCDSSKPYLCADNTCVDKPTNCRPIQQCPDTLYYCQHTVSCVANSAACSTNIATTDNTCPTNAPAMCQDGSCKKSMKECASNNRPACPSNNPIRCVDGGCVATYIDCISRTYRAYNNAIFNPQWNVNNNTCGSTSRLVCPDGTCLWSLGNEGYCKWAHACTHDKPWRCSDGSCKPLQTDCNTLSSCGGGTIRCEDGACRSNCLSYHGCPLGSYYCAGRLNQCVPSKDDCPVVLQVSSGSRRLLQSSNSNGDAVPFQEICATNCDRDRPAFTQILKFNSGRRYTVDISVDNANSVRTSMTIPESSFDDGVNIVIKPVQLINIPLVNFNDLTQPLQSTPFTIYVESAAQRLDAAPNVNLLVSSAVDRRLYTGAAQQTNANNINGITITAPCQFQTSFELQQFTAQDSSVYGDCNGIITFGVNNMNWVGNCNGGSSSIDITSNLAFISSGNGAGGLNTQENPSRPTGAACLCYNVTSSIGANKLYNIGDVICMALGMNVFTWVIDPNLIYTIRIAKDSRISASCPGPLEGPDQMNMNYLVSTNRANLPSVQCSGAGTSGSAGGNLVAPLDSCLAKLTPESTWVCLNNDFTYRFNNPTIPAKTPAGSTYNRYNGVLTETGGTYAFVAIPMPAAPLVAEAECDWWCQYKWIIIGTSAGVGALLIISSFIIWRLIRYRAKYKEKQEQLHELRERGKELDENYGGLGVYEDEVDMIANPMVIEMADLEKQMAKVNQDLGTKEQLQTREMDELDRERQRLHAEIARIKQAITTQQATRGPRRDTAMVAAPLIGNATASATTSSAAKNNLSFQSQPNERPNNNPTNINFSNVLNPQGNTNSISTDGIGVVDERTVRAPPSKDFGTVKRKKKNLDE